ncbi:MAG: UDP-N-acetylmuramoyl-L-alanyl-D-glutamate--2,6-diaminopimelate ligase [Bacteroidetes bacterium]|nr:UDP-N-acetylmuramoyl-L-alanyl-D-glutamate--2,6-diaminopimelate ligase [Bacteroidota bacterium]MDA0903346.1 UDP-N-acetylmuramoyl-L-alanyl-D-glutamate--2,6-diaminopimelate ligase [Bacteroidota bacterium]MDA1242312.1 UDP-N-acetylmuramoyl-L-alanyl-D-glutamate--2,6-diaminopimelate ligase [Bacteroidota bacterium]
MKLLSDLLYDVRILEVRGTTHLAVEDIAVDSRKVKPLGVFVAVTGTVVDGHDFIPQALAAGAACIICERLPDALPPLVTWVQVKSSAAALGHMAAAFHNHPSRDMKVVAVTGTNGKTTTVSLLHQLYRLLDRKVGMLGTVENRIVDRVLPATHTTPDALSLQAMLREMVDAGCTHVFMEASSHAIVQERMTGTHFAGAVFTNITHDHLDYHGDFNGYIKAKKQLFDRLPATAFAVINADDPHAEDMVADTRAKVVSMAVQGVADERARMVENQITGLVLHLDGQELYSQLVGGFNASNLLAVYVVSKMLGADKMNALTQMSLLKPPAGRFERVPARDGITALVDYAHTPDALDNVLKTIAHVRTGGEKVITVVGCGGDRDVAKRPVMARSAASGSDRVILTSDNPRSEDPAAILRQMEAGLDPIEKRKCLTIVDRREAIRTAAALAEPGDIVLVAGKGHETYQEIRGDKFPFDDRLELKEAFAPTT